MNTVLVATAGVAAAAVGAVGPIAIARLPEPPTASPDKPLYADLAGVPRLWLWLGLTAGLMGLATAAAIEQAWLVPVWVAVTGVGTWLGYVDLRTRLLPIRLVAPLWLGTLVLVALAAGLDRDGGMVLRAVVTSLIVYAIYRLIYQVGRLIRGGAFGYGDVRLSVVLGLALGALGVTQTVVGLYAGFVIGAVLGVPLGLLGVIDRKAFAFGPWMVLGAVVGVVWPVLI